MRYLFAKTFAPVALLLALMAVLAGGASRHESVTVDEVAHIGAGVSYLQALDLRMNGEHPPLAKALAAIPLVLRGVHADYSHTSWKVSENIFYSYIGQWVFGHWLLMRWNDPISVVLWARVPMLAIMLLLGFVLYSCASRLGGRWGGLLCLSVYVSMPAFLAFGPLVINDVTVTLFWILAVWQLPAMWQSPSRSAVVTFGLTLAAAFLSKFSAGLLFFVFVAFALSLRWRSLPAQPVDKAERRRWRRQAWRNLAKATLWAAFFVYIVYFVLSWGEPTDSFSIIPHFPASLFLRRLLMPPWVFLRGLALFALTGGTRPTYILGHTYPHGVWFYFPVLLVLKSPLAFLLLLVLAATVALAFRTRMSKRLPDTLPAAIPAGMEMHWRALWVSLLVFVAACMLNRLDISIRHFSIGLASIILLLAPLPRMTAFLQNMSSTSWTARAGKCAITALAIASLVTAVWAYPNYFPFRNALTAGRPGYLLMNDSNLDWNHALPQVELFVQEHHLQHLLLDPYAFSEPNAYVPEAELWSCQNPSPSDAGRWAVVSAGNIADGHNCLWLTKYPHQALAGGSMYAFQLPTPIPAAGSPDGPPTPDAFRYIGGIPFDVRTVLLTCIRDPAQLQPTMDRMQENMRQQMQKAKEEKAKQKK